MRPDERALREDIALIKFKVGKRRGKWALRGLKFPHALFFVAAASVPNGPRGFLLRSECSGYSAIAPTSELWHGGLDVPLEPALRPQTPQGLMVAFSAWGRCLYHPIDRLARAHGNWEREFPDKLWTPDKDITFLLETVYDLLHSSDYAGAPLPDAALSVPASFMEVDCAGAS